TMERSKPTKRGGSPVLSSRRKRRSLMAGLNRKGGITPRRLNKDEAKDTSLAASQSQQFGEDSFLECLNFDELDSFCSVPDGEEDLISSELPVMSPHRSRMRRLAELSPLRDSNNKKINEDSYKLRNTPERASGGLNEKPSKRNILKESRFSCNVSKITSSPDIFDDDSFSRIDDTVQTFYEGNKLCDKEIEINDFEKERASQNSLDKSLFNCPQSTQISKEIIKSPNIENNLFLQNNADSKVNKSQKSNSDHKKLCDKEIEFNDFKKERISPNSIDKSLINRPQSTQISQEIIKPSNIKDHNFLQEKAHNKNHITHTNPSDLQSSPPHIQSTQDFMMHNMKKTKHNKKSDKISKESPNPLIQNKIHQPMNNNSNRNQTMKQQKELSLLERAQLKKQEFQKKYKNSQENHSNEKQNSKQNSSMVNDSMNISPASSVKSVTDLSIKISPVASGKPLGSFISPPP
ncbi:unnamed protein product, partial [Meganyctiphanes norvegica]